MSRVDRLKATPTAVAIVFSLLALASLANAMLRSLPERGRLPSSRSVTDMAGNRVPLPDLMSGVELGWGGDLGDFLLATDQPQSLRLIWPVMQLHLDNHLLGDVYPQLMSPTVDWGTPLGGGSGSRSWERFLAGHDSHSVLLAWPAIKPMAQQLGISVAALRTDYDERSRFDEMRLYAAIVGADARAQSIIARRESGFDELKGDIDALGTTNIPTVMLVGLERTTGSSFGPGQHRERDSWIGRARLDYISQSREITNAERILALDPDLIVIMDSVKPTSRRLTPQQVVASPIWGVMRAARLHRVYYWRWENPLSARWLAELAHPALASQLRSRVRQSVAADFNTQLTSTQLDRLIGQDRNRGMAGAERFEDNFELVTSP